MTIRRRASPQMAEPPIGVPPYAGYRFAKQTESCKHWVLGWRALGFPRRGRLAQCSTLHPRSAKASDATELL
jgi:hypothetical protein